MSALTSELAAVLARLTLEQRERVAGRNFHCGQWLGVPVVAVLSGVGKVAAATTAATLIERFAVTAIVFTGVAGAVREDVKIGDVCIAAQFLQHDMDASPLFPRYEVPFYGRSHFATDPHLTVALGAAARSCISQRWGALSPQTREFFGLERATIHEGLVISGDQFISSSAQCQALRQALPQALAVEMEGAAIAQVCHDWQVPLGAVRIISDRADDSALIDFTRFVDEVASPYGLAIMEKFVSGRIL